MQKQWRVKTPDPKLQVEFSNSLAIHPVVAQLLINREVKTVEEADRFLKSDLSFLHDPFLLKDIDKAIARLQIAKEKKEHVLIFGDYDVDGVSSSALLRKCLKKWGLNVSNYIPHRMKEGYGLNHGVIEYAKNLNITLLFCVDCGVTAIAQVDGLNKENIDVIILDHHEPPDGKLPNAVAVINPKRKDCPYPFKYLASVGLVYKFAHALFGKPPDDDLDLVTLGTISDVVELKGENRIFVKEGLKKFAQTTNKGLAALMDVARIKGKTIRPYHIGFILGPRINATGRLGSAEKSLNLFLSETDEEAYRWAKNLEEDNRSRQKTQSGIVDEAMAIVARDVNFKEHRIIVLCKEGWHRGVIGIVASRIMDTYYRPTIVISLDDELGVGSARSIDGFHLSKALNHCSSLLENFGGHEHAAGLTIRRENIDAFRQAINDFAKDTMDSHMLIPACDIDCEIPIAQIDLELIKAIDVLEPFGEGNPAPVFCSRRLTVKGPAQVLGKDTLKFWVSDGKTILQAVGFGMACYYDLVMKAKTIDMAFKLAVDDWNKAPTVQLEVKDIRESEMTLDGLCNTT